jgi:hypothetical protein
LPGGNGNLQKILEVGELVVVEDKTMTNEQFQRAYDLAIDPNFSSLKHDISIFDGFGLRGFQPITATIEAVAACIRWQCCQMNGGIDQEALTECHDAFRRKVTMVG